MVILTPLLRQWIKHSGFRKWAYNLDGYNKFGLLKNDIECLGHYPFLNTDLYLEALRRLPGPEYDQYCYRVIRANQLEINKAFVPKEEMPTYEEDETKGRFLEPYFQEILNEQKEKEEWAEFLAKK